MSVSQDALFVAATTLQANRIGSTFEWALQQAIDNRDHFELAANPPLLVDHDVVDPAQADRVYAAQAGEALTGASS